MGLADMFSAEDRVGVKFSDFYELVKQAAMSEIMLNGIKTRIPHAHIEAMWDGKNSELEQYRGTGMSPEEISELCKMQEADNKKLHGYEQLGVSPEQIKELDKLYAEKCKELASFTKLNIPPEEIVQMCKRVTDQANEIRQLKSDMERLMQKKEAQE